MRAWRFLGRDVTRPYRQIKVDKTLGFRFIGLTANQCYQSSPCFSVVMELEEYQRMFDVEETHWWFVGKRKFAETYLTRLKLTIPLRLFYAGCGTGALSHFLSRFGMVTSMDYSITALALCRRRQLPQLCQGDMAKLPFGNASFDVVTAFDVLYHQWVQDDHLVLEEFHRVLKPGGKLLITDSAFRFLAGQHDRVFFARERYTVGQMVDRLTRTGFRIHQKSYAFFFTFPIVVTVRLIEKMLPAKRTPDVSLPAPLLSRRIITTN